MFTGQLNASLTSFSRTIDEYNQLAKHELSSPKQEKAIVRVKTFRTELAEFREQFDRLKTDREEVVRRPASFLASKTACHEICVIHCLLN